MSELPLSSRLENYILQRGKKIFTSNKYIHELLILYYSLKDKLSNREEKYLKKYMVPKNNGCFVDIGANTGYWTFLVAKKDIEVHAFEPSPQSYPILERKVKKYSKVHVYPCALGEQCYDANLSLHFQSGHDSLTKREYNFEGRQVIVTVKTLDSFNFPNVGLIKIDTEGYEIPILLGANRTISTQKPRLIIEVHRPYKKQKERIIEILEKFDYHWIVYGKHEARQHIICH